MAQKRGTTPRKAAARRKDEDEPITEAVDGLPPPEPGPEVDKDRVPSHPYGEGVKLYIYHPKDGSAPIVFPHISEVRPTQKFFWQIYKMNEMFQSFEWMNLAGVPREIQERVLDMGERDIYEQANFFRDWFAPISRPQGGLAPPGES